MKPRNPYQPKNKTTAGVRPSRSKVQDNIGSIAEMNHALNAAMHRMGIRTDGQLMRENYKAGVGRRAGKGRPAENDADFV